MAEPFPSNPRAVIHPHRMDTVGFLLATSPPCARLLDEEVRRVRRTLVALPPGGTPPKPLPRSWLLAVLVCPGDNLAGIAPWVRSLPLRERERVWLYLHPDTDPIAALAPWYAAGLEDPVVSLAHDFKTFHKSFGARLNLQTYTDFK